MAKSQKTWEEAYGESAKEREVPKIGEFAEAPGGGKPLPKGAKAPSKEWVKENRKMQPRDTDGTFTYNSANKKPLEYGPSRGKTVPPFLSGVKLTFAKKSGRGAVIMPDGKMFRLPENIKTASDFVRSYMEYRKMDDTFLGFNGSGEIEFGSLSSKAAGRGGKPGKDSIAITRSYISDAKHFTGKGPFRPTEPPKDDDDGVDYSLAKTDPDEFIKQNYKTIKDIVDLASSKGYSLNVDDMVDSIAKGEFKNFKQIKDMIGRM